MYETYTCYNVHEVDVGSPKVLRLQDLLQVDGDRDTDEFRKEIPSDDLQ